MELIRFPTYLARGDHSQIAALPFLRDGKRIKVCLITSRETKRWVIPKGWHKSGLAPHESAAEEALEEAGLSGSISKKPIGSYRYRKRLHIFFSVLCRVDVFPLRVENQLATWKEQIWRERKWVSLKKAAQMVDEPDLADLIANFTDH